MHNILNEKLAKIAKKKHDLLERERLLKERGKERQKKQRVKQSIEIGKLACKANIDAIDKDVLLGAFLEISERAQKSDHVEKWKADAVSFIQSSSSTQEAPLSLSFQTQISKDIQNHLKNLGFRWNKFRKEYYGYGKKSELEEFFKGTQCRVEALD